MARGGLLAITVLAPIGTVRGAQITKIKMVFFDFWFLILSFSTLVRSNGEKGINPSTGVWPHLDYQRIENERLSARREYFNAFLPFQNHSSQSSQRLLIIPI